MQAQPATLILGHITRDLIGHTTRLGGAVSYAAQAAHIAGRTAHVITSCRDESDLLTPLRELDITITAIPAYDTTTFVLDYSGPVRRLELRSRAHDILPTHLPADMTPYGLVYIAPVAGECAKSLVEAVLRHPDITVVLGLQGWLRSIEHGEVRPACDPMVFNPPPGISAMIFSELDHPDAENIARTLATHVPVVALTRGAQGATLFERNRITHIPAAPAHEVDPTGAGDVFGMFLGLALMQGLSPHDAAVIGSQAAARVVEGPGMGSLNKISLPKF